MINFSAEIVIMGVIRKINKEGPKRHQLGIILEDNEQFKSHGLWYDILSNEKKVGDMTCGIWSRSTHGSFNFEPPNQSC